MRFLWLTAAFFCSSVSGQSYRASVVLYDNSSCAAPASVVMFPNADCRLPQEDHYAPVCQDNSFSCSVTDCDWYYVGGYDYYGFLQRAFGDSVPYLIVEEYRRVYWAAAACAMAWEGGDYGLGDVTAYRFDEVCHSNRDGTGATRLMLDDKLTITKYNDASCSSVQSQKVVTWQMATQGQCVDNTKFYLRGAKPAMAAVAVFDDMACSIPTKTTFTQHFGCSASQDRFTSSCGPRGATQYSTSACTDDYSSFIESTFGGSTRYLAVEKHSDSRCGALQSVTVYVADGSCHTNVDDGTSFIATLNEDGSGAIEFYSDSYCSELNDNVEVTKQVVTHYTCTQGCEGDYCSKRYFVGGFGGPPAKGLMTAVSVYDSTSCSQPAATMKLTREVSCTPQLKPLEPECENIDGVYSISDCEVYEAGGWDSSGLIGQAFGDHTRLTVEEYDTTFGECAGTDALIQATVYLLDEECHPNRDSTASTKLNLGRFLTISTYNDPFCTVPISETRLTWGSVFHANCVDGSTRPFINSWPDLTAVAIFDGGDCSERPVKLQFTQLFGCNVAQDPIRSVCGPDGSSHSSISSCTRDYSGLAYSAFGSDTPYLMVEEFADDSCSRVQNVNVYTADGSCHTNTDDTTSFMTTISKDGSATINTFFDPSCTVVDDTTSVSKRKLVESSTCYSRSDCGAESRLCSSRISYGGLGSPPSNGQLTAVIVHGTDSSCSQRAEMVKYTRELVCAPQPDYWGPNCEKSGELYYTSYCTSYWGGGSDDYGLLDRAFGSNAYLLVEEYDLSFGECGDPYATDTVAAYLLDEDCHESSDGTSYQLTLGNTAVLTKFDDPVCTAVSSQTEVSWWTAYRGSCVNGSPGPAAKYHFRGPHPPLTALAVYDDSECSGKPVELRFSQDFVCGATLHPEKSVCGAEGTALYSISSCTDDYSGLTDTVFGTDVPYIMVEEFDDYYCGLTQAVNVYTADGACHSSVDGSTSFTATITADGSATITTYSDAMCSVIDKSSTMTKRELTAFSCLQDRTECSDEDGLSCSKRISVGGLGGFRSKGRMVTVAAYNSTGCPPPASSVTFSRGLMCLQQSSGGSPACGDNGTMSSATDCIGYDVGGGWDAQRLIGRVFGSSRAYILVEEYDESVISTATLAKSTAYLYDSACHATQEGTASTRLTLGRSVTITEYEDPYCGIVSRETEITFAEAYNNYFIDGKLRAYLPEGSPDLTAVAVYGDSSCSELPVKLTLSQYFECKGERDIARSVCEQSTASLYSTSSCTRDYLGLASSVFGDENPYVIVEEFSDGSCGLIQDVTVYAADGACHTNSDGVTSFRATLASNSAATITRYTDARCKTVEDSESLRYEILYYSCIQSSDCADAGRYGCSKRYSVGGFGGSPSLGRMTGITMYRDSSCSQPAETVTITRDLVCNPKTDDNGAGCRASDRSDLYSTSRCVSADDSWDKFRVLDDAFGWRSHLVVEEYDTSIGSCWSQNGLASVTGYSLDEKCHTNSLGTSSKLTFGRSLILTKYDDADCSSVSSQTEVTWDMIAYGCVGDHTMYYLRGPAPDLTAVAVYSDRSCGGTPTKLELARRLGCNAEQDPSQYSCTEDGWTLYSTSSCVSDYAGFISTRFGDDAPYVIEEKFRDRGCGQLESVTVYTADGSCQANTDGATSFTASISVANQATIVTYSDAYCGAVNSTTIVDNVRNDTFGASCDWGTACTEADGSSCSKRFSVGGVGRSRSMASKAVVIYEDGYCDGPPVQLMVTNQWACSAPPKSGCSATLNGSTTVYQDYACIDDVVEFAASQFGSAPYLVVEHYVEGTRCSTQQGAVVFRADGGCYYNAAAGTSFSIFPNVGGSVTIATYPNSNCNDYEADYVTIGAKYIGTGECLEGQLRLYANMTGLLTPAKQTHSSDMDFKAREEIMFPEWLWDPAPRRIFESS